MEWVGLELEPILDSNPPVSIYGFSLATGIGVMQTISFCVRIAIV